MTHADNRIAYFDQIALELQRVTDRRQLMQALWVYERPVDLDALRAFHRRFGSGLMGRLVQRSLLPFGRPRWISAPGPHSDIEIAEKPRPRDEFMDWADEQAKRFIDPERGPGWVMGVLPMTDGSTAVSVVCSHCLADGVGMLTTVHNAVTGVAPDFGYPPAGSRLSLAADLRDAVREIPEGLRAARALAADRLRTRGRDTRPRTRRPDAPRPDSAEPEDPALDRVVAIPSIVTMIDTAAWDAAASRIGGNSYALVAGFAAKVAERLGRARDSDGKVTLVIAGNARQNAEDDRALAMSFASTVIDPHDVANDLTPARDAIRAAREQAGRADPTSKQYPLVAWIPRRAAMSVVQSMFSYSDSLPSSCSNLGEMPRHLLDVDGTPADIGFARAIDRGVTLRDLHRSQGTLVVLSGRINGRIWLAVEAYQLGAENSRARLHGIVDGTLAEFGVTATSLSGANG